MSSFRSPSSSNHSRQHSTQASPSGLTPRAHRQYDPKYEFDCDKFYEFETGSDTEERADTWFDNKKPSPKQNNDNRPERDDHDGAIADDDFGDHNAKVLLAEVPEEDITHATAHNQKKAEIHNKTEANLDLSKLEEKLLELAADPAASSSKSKQESSPGQSRIPGPAVFSAQENASSSAVSSPRAQSGSSSVFSSKATSPSQIHFGLMPVSEKPAAFAPEAFTPIAASGPSPMSSFQPSTEVSIGVSPVKPASKKSQVFTFDSQKSKADVNRSLASRILAKSKSAQSLIRSTGKNVLSQSLVSTVRAQRDNIKRLLTTTSQTLKSRRISTTSQRSNSNRAQSSLLKRPFRLDTTKPITAESGMTPKTASSRRGSNASTVKTPVSRRSSVVSSATTTQAAEDASFPSFARTTLAARSRAAASATKLKPSKPTLSRPQSARKVSNKDASVLTRPETPKLQTNRRSRRADDKSSEDRELEEVMSRREELKKQSAANAKSAEKVLNGLNDALALPARSVAPLTQPEEFKLHTTARIKPVTITPAVDSSARKRKIIAQSKETGLTKPTPFPLLTSARVKPAPSETEPSQPFISLVNQQTQFFESLGTPSNSKSVSSGLTTPSPFNFVLHKRERKATHASTEQQQLMELRDKPLLQSTPLEKLDRIFQSNGEIGVPKVPKKDTTEFREFKLSQSQRRPSEDLQDPDIPFKAQALDNRIFQGDPREEIKEKIASENISKLTKPESPEFVSKLLQRKRKSPESKSAIFKARPAPNFKELHERLASPAVHKRTRNLVPVPFHLETENRGAIKQEELQKRLQAEEEERQRRMHFRATDVHVVSPKLFSRSHTRDHNPVDVVPFNLKGDSLSQHAREFFIKKVEDERRKEEEGFSSFKAKPFNKQHSFVVKKSNKPLTEPSNDSLHSDIRSSEREKFDIEREQREHEKDETQRKLETEKENVEREELRHIRQKMVHKALPMPDDMIETSYSDVVQPAKSDKPLTMPMSPPLMTKRRALQQVQIEDSSS